MTASLEQQLAALRTGAAFCSPDLRFPLRVTGGEALPWLERLCSLPVADMEAGTHVDAVLMDGKGRMRADLRILAPGVPTDGLLLDLPRSHQAQLLKVLDMFIIQDDVQLEDLSGDMRVASVLGPRAAEVLSAARLHPPEPGKVIAPREDVLLLATGAKGMPGFDLVFERNVGRELVEDLLESGAERVEAEALEVERIASGVPFFGPDLSQEVIPLEAGLDEHVSITKGCYPGQEVVARILNLGQVSRKLVRLEAEGAPALEAGAHLSPEGDADGRIIGQLTSVSHDPTSGRTVALGFVRRGSWSEGDRVVTDGDTPVALTVHDLRPA